MTALAPPEKAEVQADLDRLRDYLAREDIEGARCYILALAERWPDSAEIQRYARALAPPAVLRVGAGPEERFAESIDWAVAHGGEFRGQWLAVYKGRLLAADRDLTLVQKLLRDHPDRDGVLLRYQP